MDGKKFLSESEYCDLMKVIEKYKSTCVRDTILLELLIRTGSRVGEMLNLRHEDINHESRSIFIRGNKGSLDREMPITDDLYLRLSKYSASREKFEFTKKIFPVHYNTARNIWHQYRPTKKRLHCLRHTYAVRSYRKCKDVLLIKGCLGHKELKSTMIYQSFVNSVDERRALLD